MMMVTTVRKQVVAWMRSGESAVDSLDHDGNLWALPSNDQSWEYRQPFEPTEETDLSRSRGITSTCSVCRFNGKQSAT